MINDILLNLEHWIFDSLRDIVIRMTITLTVIFILYLIRRFFLALLFRTKRNTISKNIWQRNTAYLTFVICVFILFPVWLPSLQNALAVLGIFGAGVVLVLKEAILNIGGWFYIITRRPFEEGNRITIGGHTGDIIEIRVQEISMIEVRPRENGGQSTGRILHIPTSQVFTTPYANSSKEFLFNWNEIKIPLTLRSDWKKAVTIVEEIAEATLETITASDSRIRHSEEKYSIRYRNLQPGVYVEMSHGAIIIILRHLAEPRNTRQITDMLWREILTRFAKEKRIQLSDSSDIH